MTLVHVTGGLVRMPAQVNRDACATNAGPNRIGPAPTLAMAEKGMGVSVGGAPRNRTHGLALTSVGSAMMAWFRPFPWRTCNGSSHLGSPEGSLTTGRVG